jgi:hypothetical protein
MSKIKTGRIRRRGKEQRARKEAVSSITGQAESELSKEETLKGGLTIMDALLGLGTTALMGATGGTLTPLILGLGKSYLKKWTEEGARKHLKLGADPSAITSPNRYGKTAAEELRKKLSGEVEGGAWSPGSLAADVGLSYLSALTPQWTSGTEGAGEFKSAINFKDFLKPDKWLPKFGSNTDNITEAITSINPNLWKAKYGGRVPRKKYYGGGSVTGGNALPTIADYFSKQNKTVSGNNIKSIAGVLGRR